MHYSHMFRVDTLSTPPKSDPRSSVERWISSSTLAKDADDESPTKEVSPWSPGTILRTPVIPATPENTSRRSPTPHFLRENSPGTASPLTPIQFMRRANPTDLSSLAPTTTPVRERSPGLSSDGGNSAPGSVSSTRTRPRLSSNANTTRPLLQAPTTPANRLRPWR